MTDSFDASAQSPDLQDLRRQARQRFVGAAMLVLIAVIALPFLLDTKPRPVSADMAIEMQAPAATAPAPTPAPVPTPTPQAAPDKSIQPDVTAVEAPKPEPAKPEKTDDGTRAAALLNGTGYQIQAGSFTDTTKLAAVQAKLDKAGFQNFTQDVIAKDGTAHTRIRLGPFATQLEANAVAARIGKLGIKTIVIKP